MLCFQQVHAQQPPRLPGTHQNAGFSSLAADSTRVHAQQPVNASVFEAIRCSSLISDTFPPGNFRLLRSSHSGVTCRSVQPMPKAAWHFGCWPGHGTAGCHHAVDGSVTSLRSRYRLPSSLAGLRFSARRNTGRADASCLIPRRSVRHCPSVDGRDIAELFLKFQGSDVEQVDVHRALVGIVGLVDKDRP